MFNLRLLRYRSLVRDSQNDERRLAFIQKVVHSAIAEAEAETDGLRSRMFEARNTIAFLVERLESGEADQSGRAELNSLEVHLVAGERRLAQLKDHLELLRSIQVAAMGPDRPDR